MFILTISKGKPIYDHWDGYGSVGIVDLDSRDKYLDIWVYDDGPSDDPGYYFFRKVENKIIKTGELGVERGFLCDGKGRILAAHRDLPWISLQVFNCYYTIENNKFRKHTLVFLTIRIMNILRMQDFLQLLC